MYIYKYACIYVACIYYKQPKEQLGILNLFGLVWAINTWDASHFALKGIPQNLRRVDQIWYNIHVFV